MYAPSHRYFYFICPPILFSPPLLPPLPNISLPRSSFVPLPLSYLFPFPLFPFALFLSLLSSPSPSFLVYSFIETLTTPHSRLLLLAYPSGLQVWDCSDLASVREVLNLNLDSELGKDYSDSPLDSDDDNVYDAEGGGWGGQVVHAAILPGGKDGEDGDGERPFLGVL